MWESWGGSRPNGDTSILDPHQIDQYCRQGFLLASGLIPDSIAEAAESAMWRLLDSRPDDPSTWTSAAGGHRVDSSPELLACYTADMLEAGGTLAGPGETLNAPSRAYAINVFPSAAEWSWPKPHVDHAIKEHGHKTFPRAFRIAAMTYLSDVAPHGAGTVVWPGSHLVIEEMALSDPSRYEMMWTLNQELGNLSLGDPVELLPRRGDVLFYSYLCAHAGSMNTSGVPRLALNAKW